MAEKKHPPLRDRSENDENFCHTLKLCGPCLAWAETVEIGHPLDWNDLNMVKIPAEILLAMINTYASRQDQIGSAAREALSLFQAFRDVSKPKPKPKPKPRKPKDAGMLPL